MYLNGLSKILQKKKNLKINNLIAINSQLINTQYQIEPSRIPKSLRTIEKDFNENFKRTKTI